jgi:pyruvate/2-oxoglutarate dehydrogenase complex dihydrolipoamide dehydrogenase (E3) component
MTTATTPERFDALILGSGQAGKPLAGALANAGWKTVLVEREFVGGTCINFGCTPTKTMVASARVAHLARRGADYGVRTGPIAIDMGKVVERKRAIVERFRNYGEQRLRQTKNLDLVYGSARFLDARTVEVALRDGGTRTMTAGKIVINTGGRPAVPPVPGLSDVPFLDSTSIMELREVPRHLLVLGGGFIGLEFAQMFRRFGAEVTVLEGAPRLAARDDEDVGRALREVLEQDGLRIECGAVAERVDGRAGDIAVTYRQGGASHTVRGTHLMVSTGRRPNTDDLNLAAAGVTVDRAGFVTVDDTLQTSVAGIYAAGDVKGGPAFTHVSYDDFRILRDRWVRNLDARVGDRLVPNTVFTDPQLASVGINETTARARGLDIRVARIGMSGIARALETDESRGFLKVIVDAKSDQILGCTVFGIEGGEIMSMLQIAMMGKLPYTVLKEAIFAHPTLAEGLNNVFLALDA